MDRIMSSALNNKPLIFFVMFALFQLAFSVGVIENNHNNYIHSVLAVNNKIISDSDTLPFDSLQVAQEKTPEAFLSYIEQLNSQLQVQSAPLFIESITLTATPPNSVPMQEDGVNTYPLKKDELTIGFITFRLIPSSPSNFFSIWVVLSALLMAYFVSQLCRREESIEQVVDVTLEAKKPTVWLQIDLKEKKLRNTLDGSEVYLANKPLCFYCALIDYCLEYPDEFLNPNKELPEAFLKFTNKYFSRLMDLGHTIRKRPNFSNNVEKTLSEIRAALDEIYHNDIDKKAIFSPPKAIGEGSRSKAHNVSLQSLEPNKVVFLGK